MKEDIQIQETEQQPEIEEDNQSSSSYYSNSSQSMRAVDESPLKYPEHLKERMLKNASDNHMNHAITH